MDKVKMKIFADQIFEGVPNLEQEGMRIFKEEGQAGLDRYVDSVLAKHVPGGGKEAWDRNPELRKEFGENLNAYEAYLKAEAEGRVKIAGNKIIR